MGCGISRINLMEESMACGGLKRRIVQVRSRNDLLAAHHDPGTASTKMLLKDDQRNFNIPRSGDATDSHNSCRRPDDHVDVRNYKNVSSTADASPVIKDPPLQHQIRGKEYLSAEHHDQRHLGKCCESPLITNKMGISRDDHEDHREKETCHRESDDDDEGRRISNYDGATLIGSPSFREYCVDYESDDHDAVNHGEDSNGSGRGEKENRTQLGMDDLICNDEVCIRGQEVPKKHMEKKGSTTRSGSKFRKVMFPMHMKTRRHLSNVTACYSRTNHHQRVLPASAAENKLPEKLV